MSSEWGAALRAARRAAGLTQRQLAGQAAVTPTYLSHVEHGRMHGAGVYRRVKALLPTLSEPPCLTCGHDPTERDAYRDALRELVAAWESGHWRDEASLRRKAAALDAARALLAGANGAGAETPSHSRHVAAEQAETGRG